jgi:(2Fe-2S) ferredoxin
VRADPLVGSAPQARSWLLLEHPGPWRVDAVAGSAIDSNALAGLTDRAVESATRILLVRRPGRPSPGPPRRWILVGLDGTTRSGPWRHDADLAAAAAALDGDQSAVVDLGPILLVCTHGVHDTCCALRGRPVAAALAVHWPDQVWECSHVGGDRFAPNVLVLPDGFYYGNLDPETAVATIQRHLGGEVVVEHLRGMARFAPPVQAAAAAVFDRCGPLAVDDVRVRSVRQIGPHLGHGSETFVELDLADGRSARVDVLSVRRPEARLTCRAARETPATEYRVEIFEVRTAD